MSGPQYRMLLAGVNVLVIVVIGLLAVRIVKGSEVPPAQRPPANFDPLDYAIESQGDSKPGSQFQVISAELDRPMPKRPVVPVDTSGQTKIVRPPPEIESTYSLVMAAADPRDKTRSSVILKDLSQEQFTVSVGDDFDGYRVVDIVIRGLDDERIAIVTLLQGSTRHTIELRRHP